MQTHFLEYLPADLAPMTIRQLLRKWLIPRKWQHLLRIQEKITVNHHYHHFDELVHGGDLIEMNFDFLPENTQHYLPATNYQPEILYEDATTIIVNKPAGLKTHPNRPDETGSMLNFLQAEYPDILIVHRLDQQTSGALLVAKNTVAVPIYNRQLTLKVMRRDYLAWVSEPTTLSDQGGISLPIGPDPTDKRKFCVDDQSGLSAQTNYRVLRRTESAALVAISLETGRTHQIRVHFAAIGHPIVGDPLYNPAYQPAQKMLLHGYQLHFYPPFQFNEQQISAPLPEYFPK